MDKIDNPYDLTAENVSEGEIKNLVHTFYTKIRNNNELAPVFDEVIKDQWPAHLEKMCDFWSTCMLLTDRYDGNPMLKHMEVPSIKPQHFQTWLKLFEETTQELFQQEIANKFNIRARGIASALQSRLFQNLN